MKNLIIYKNMVCRKGDGDKQPDIKSILDFWKNGDTDICVKIMRAGYIRIITVNN